MLNIFPADHSLTLPCELLSIVPTATRVQKSMRSPYCAANERTLPFNNSKTNYLEIWIQSLIQQSIVHRIMRAPRTRHASPPCYLWFCSLFSTGTSHNMNYRCWMNAKFEKFQILQHIHYKPNTTHFWCLQCGHQHFPSFSPLLSSPFLAIMYALGLPKTFWSMNSLTTAIANGTAT